MILFQTSPKLKVKIDVGAGFFEVQRTDFWVPPGLKTDFTISFR